MSTAIRDRAEMAKEIGERVREARKALGWSQEKLAREVGMSRETIRRIEDGITLPAVNTIEGLATALDLHPVALLGSPWGDSDKRAYLYGSALSDLRLGEALAVPA